MTEKSTAEKIYDMAIADYNQVRWMAEQYRKDIKKYDNIINDLRLKIMFLELKEEDYLEMMREYWYTFNPGKQMPDPTKNADDIPK